MFVVLLAMFVVVIFFGYPKTQGYTLEQMVVLFDRDDALPAQMVVLERKMSAAASVANVDERD